MSCWIITLSIMSAGTIAGIFLLVIYTSPNPPKLSIEELSVPVFNNLSDQTSRTIYFYLKLRNMNKAIGLYYDDPFNIAFFYYPYEDSLHKYVLTGTVPAFYQGNGKTTHIRSKMENNLQVLSTVVVQPEEKVESNQVRTLLRNYIQLPSTMSGNQVMAETRQDMVGRTRLMNFRIAVVINYRFKYWAGSSKHKAELGANVLVDLSTGEAVSAGSIDLVKSAAPTGGPVMLMVFLIPFLLIMCSYS